MNPNLFENFFPGIGPTDELSLRVSSATLVRVLLERPTDGEPMLALERKATFHEGETGQVVDIVSQPLGGALRIHDLDSLQSLLGDFHFDGQESLAEHDFRIFIRPSDWEAVRAFCLRHFDSPDDPILETDPTRELTEEFADALGVELKQDQYTSRAVGTILEDHPTPTKNSHAMGYSTARIYRIFEARILDGDLAAAMIKNSENCSDHDLRELAMQNFRSGGPGRANAMLTLPFKDLRAAYSTILPAARNKPISFHDHQLDETVAAILDGVSVPKYLRLSNHELP
jgi:hypothetical protein